MKCLKIWQPNYSDTKSYKRGYMWRCFCCGKVAKHTCVAAEKVASSIPAYKKARVVGGM